MRFEVCSSFTDRDQCMTKSWLYIFKQEVIRFSFRFLVMTWCLYYLAIHQDVQEKLYQEMVSVLGEETITAQIISELTYAICKYVGIVLSVAFT